MKNKKLLYAAVSILSVIIVLAVFLIIWFWGDSYNDFNSKTFKTEFDIPDLESGAAPQGMTAYYTGDFTVKGEKAEDGTTTPSTTYQKDNYFFISAYMPKGPSRVYVIGEEQGLIGYVTFVNDDNTEHSGHVGGIAINRDNIWISSDRVNADGSKTGFIYVAQVSSSFKSTNSNGYLYQEIIDKAAKSKTGGDNTVQFTAYFHAQGGNDFLYYYNANNYGGSTTPSTNDRLYAGEFARTDDKTYKKRHLKTPVIETRDSSGELTGKTAGGDKNHAFVYEYRVAATYTNTEYKTGLYYIEENTVKAESGYQVPKIQAIYSVPDDIQGFARTVDGKLILSQSYALKNSKLYYYDWEKVYNTATVKTADGTNIKIVDNKKLYSSDEVAGERFEYEGVTFTSGAPYKVNDLYVYFADSSSLERVYDIPSMSEGLCVMKDKDGEQRVYVLFESGAKKYRIFVRQILTNVYSFIPNKDY